LRFCIGREKKEKKGGAFSEKREGVSAVAMNFVESFSEPQLACGKKRRKRRGEGGKKKKKKGPKKKKQNSFT